MCELLDKIEFNNYLRYKGSYCAEMGIDLVNLRKCAYTYEQLEYKSKENLINMFLELQKTTKGSMDLNDKLRKDNEKLKVKITKRKPFIKWR